MEAVGGVVPEVEGEAAILAAVMHRVVVTVEVTGAEGEGTLLIRELSWDHFDTMRCLLILCYSHLSKIAMVGKARRSFLGFSMARF